MMKLRELKARKHAVKELKETKAHRRSCLEQLRGKKQLRHLPAWWFLETTTESPCRR